MIKSISHAFIVQSRRRESGKRGRSKAVRRWFKRVYGRGVEAHSDLDKAMKIGLSANFENCRSFNETHIDKLKKESK